MSIFMFQVAESFGLRYFRAKFYFEKQLYMKSSKKDIKDDRDSGKTE